MLLLPSASEFGSDWSEILFVPYGEGEEALGTAQGGDMGSLDLGPEHGAQAPDGSWWFLDAAKWRLAHYSETGEYLGAVAMKQEHLAQGEYFQFQLPHILGDGTPVAQGPGGGTTVLLLLENGDTRIVSVPADLDLRYDDGTFLYGFSDEGRLMTKVDSRTGDPESVDWFQTRVGERFRLEIHGDQLTVDLPDVSGAAVLSWRIAYADDPTTPAYGMVEVASGGDGTLFLYLLGGTDSGAGGQHAGYLSISPDGVASPVEPTRDPFTPSDPGSPAHPASVRAAARHGSWRSTPTESGSTSEHPHLKRTPKPHSQRGERTSNDQISVLACRHRRWSGGMRKQKHEQ